MLLYRSPWLIIKPEDIFSKKNFMPHIISTNIQSSAYNIVGSLPSRNLSEKTKSKFTLCNNLWVIILYCNMYLRILRVVNAGGISKLHALSGLRPWLEGGAAEGSIDLVAVYYIILLCKFSLKLLYYNIVPRARTMRIAPELEASSFLQQHIPTFIPYVYAILYYIKQYGMYTYITYTRMVYEIIRRGKNEE